MLLAIFLLGFALNIYLSYDDWSRGRTGDAFLHILTALLMLALGITAYMSL